MTFSTQTITAWACKPKLPQRSGSMCDYLHAVYTFRTWGYLQTLGKKAFDASGSKELREFSTPSILKAMVAHKTQLSKVSLPTAFSRDFQHTKFEIDHCSPSRPESRENTVSKGRISRMPGLPATTHLPILPWLFSNG